MWCTKTWQFDHWPYCGVQTPDSLTSALIVVYKHPTVWLLTLLWCPNTWQSDCWPYCDVQIPDHWCVQTPDSLTLMWCIIWMAGRKFSLLPSQSAENVMFELCVKCEQFVSVCEVQTVSVSVRSFSSRWVGVSVWASECAWAHKTCPAMFRTTTSVYKKPVFSISLSVSSVTASNAVLIPRYMENYSTDL